MKTNNKFGRFNFGLITSVACYFLFVNHLFGRPTFILGATNLTEKTFEGSLRENLVEIEKALQPLGEFVGESHQNQTEIDINSIDDGLVTPNDKGNSDRHHYEQQQEQVVLATVEETTPQPTTQAPQLLNSIESTMSNEVLLPASKPEPRNQQDSGSQSAQVLDPIIIDHRPGGGGLDQTGGAGLPPVGFGQQQQSDSYEAGATTQPPQQFQATPSSGSNSGSSSAASILHSSYVSGPISHHVTAQPTTTIQYQATPTSTTQTGAWSHSAASQPAITIGTYAPPASQQQHQGISRQSFVSLQPTQQQSAGPSYGGSMMASSNQVVTTVPHPHSYPTSINSIISDQQQQQIHMQQQPVAQASMQMNQATSGTLQQQPQQQQQQQQQQQLASGQQMVTVNGQPTNLVLVNSNGGPLNGSGRRISTWLRGISSMLANIFNRREHGLQLAPATGGGGHWILGGSNGPHWLSQAQSLLHQQQLLGAASSNRYATFVPSPQATTVQQQPAASTMTITMQPAPISAGSSQQQLIQAPTGGGDLQASASSQGFPITIQAPSGFQFNQQQQQHQQQYHPSASSAPNTGSQTIVVGSGSTQGAQPTTGANNRAAQIASEQQVSRQQPKAISGQQQQTVTTITATWSPAASTALTNQQQQQQQHSSSSQTQPRYGRSSALASANSNLPLAHYSRYATSSD